MIWQQHDLNIYKPTWEEAQPSWKGAPNHLCKTLDHDFDDSLYTNLNGCCLFSYTGQVIHWNTPMLSVLPIVLATHWTSVNCLAVTMQTWFVWFVFAHQSVMGKYPLPIWWHASVLEAWRCLYHPIKLGNPTDPSTHVILLHTIHFHLKKAAQKMAPQIASNNMFASCKRCRNIDEVLGTYLKQNYYSSSLS